MTSAPLSDVKSISPKLHQKFSPNLYKWMANGPGKRYGLQRVGVYRDSHDTLWIGYMDPENKRELFGAKLMAVLCNGSRETTAAWQGFDGVEVVDFWDRYVSVGRCAIDTKHTMFFIGDDSRWTTDGDARECTWCGAAKQTMQRWTATIEKTQWVTA